MKKYLLVVVCILMVQAAFAQDVIIKVSGDEIKANVLEITLTQIIYSLPDTTLNEKHSILKSEVFMVRFANGTKEVFQENLPLISETADPAAMYLRGQQDARLYYKGEGALWGAAATMILVGPAGPVVIGAVKPKAHRNVVPSHALLADVNYVRGYEKQAHKRKIGKAAVGAGIGTGIMVAFLVIALAGMQ